MPEPQIVFSGKKFNVRREFLDSGDGQQRPYDVVTHPGAAVILPLLPDGRVVLIRNFRPAVGAELLELPAGTIDLPESPITCAERELTEETGYSAGKIVKLASFYSSPGICTELMHAFLATDLSEGATRHEAGELIRIEAIKYEQALQAIQDGRIIDGKTIATMLYYDRFVRGQDG